MSDVSHLLPQTTFEKVADVASIAAIASPWWLPVLKETSELAAFILPILGVVWLATQIGWKWYRELQSDE